MSKPPAIRAAVKRSADVVSGMPGYGREAAKSTARRSPKLFKNLFRTQSQPTWVMPAETIAAMREADLSGVWLGHATVMLRLGGAGGKWVLTDPVFSQRIGLRLGNVTVGVPRLQPAVDPASLPRPDIVLLSHAHFDHFDKPSLRALASKDTAVVTARNTGKLVPKGFGDVLEIDWGKELQFAGVRIGALQPNHWGARTMWDRHRGFNSYLIEGPASQRALFAGDTAMTTAFDGLGKLDLSIFGIGAYDPWIHVHASPEQVWEMHQRSGAERILPMHHSTFELSDEPIDEPLRRLLSAAGTAGARVIGKELGEIWSTNWKQSAPTNLTSTDRP
jgi:L-ascorbate metabolism protein UlaG (beta-lactamase superfamily)